MAAQLEAQLSDQKPYVREQGCKSVKPLLDSGNVDIQELNTLCLSLTHSPDNEKLLAGLLLGRELISMKTQPGIEEVLKDISLRMLTHSDGKVRQTSGEVIQTLAGQSEDMCGVCLDGVLAVFHSCDSESSVFIESSSQIINALAAVETFQMTELNATQLLTVVKPKHRSKSIRENAQSLLNEISHKASPLLLSQLAVLPMICEGLEDTWGPVRLQALRAANEYISHTPQLTKEQEALLLPRICLNRYYPAEGLRNLALETWRGYVGDTGRTRLVSHLSSVCDYYQSQSHSDSAACREAACHCISELATKVESLAHETLALQLPKLLSAVLERMEDSDWAVQDAACLAGVELTSAFVKETYSQIREVETVWIRRLSDQRVSMRENCAYGLVKVAAKLQEGGLWRDIDTYIRSNGPKAWEQSSYERTHSPISPGLRDPQPWEFSDGCVFLIKELSAVKSELAAPHLPLLADLARVKSFSSHIFLKDSIWKSIPSIASGLGKRLFKDHLESFLDELLGDAESKV